MTRRPGEKGKSLSLSPSQAIADFTTTTTHFPLFLGLSVCVVHACGLDSIPWDLGALTAMRGGSQRCYSDVGSVTAYGILNARPSTGTLTTVLHLCSQLSPSFFVKAVGSWLGNGGKKEKGLVKRAVKMVPRIPFFPHYASEVHQWVIPTVGSLDGFVVRRSANLLHRADPASPQ